MEYRLLSLKEKLKDGLNVIFSTLPPLLDEGTIKTLHRGGYSCISFECRNNKAEK